MQLLHELKIFFQKGKKKSPAKAELKLQILRIWRQARKWVFSQAAQRETPLRSPSYFVLAQLGFSFAFEFCFFGLFSSVLLGVCLYWRGEAEPLVYIQAHA